MCVGFLIDPIEDRFDERVSCDVCAYCLQVQLAFTQKFFSTCLPAFSGFYLRAESALSVEGAWLCPHDQARSRRA